NNTPRVHCSPDCTSRTGDEVQCTFRQNSGVNNFTNHSLSQKRGIGRGFNYCRHSCHPVNRTFLQHSPHREIKSVNMYCHSTFRHHYVMPHKSSAPRQIYRLSFYVVWQIGEHFTQGSIGKKISEPTFNIDPAIHFCGTGTITYIIEI